MNSYSTQERRSIFTKRNNPIHLIVVLILFFNFAIVSKASASSEIVPFCSLLFDPIELKEPSRWQKTLNFVSASSDKLRNWAPSIKGQRLKGNLILSPIFRNYRNLTDLFDGIKPNLNREDMAFVRERVPRTQSEPFATFVESLKPGELIYDSGGGSGLAAFDIVNRFDIRAITVSAEDFITAFDSTLKSVRPDEIVIGAGNYIRQIGPVGPEIIQNIAETLGREFNTYAETHIHDPRKQRAARIENSTLVYQKVAATSVRNLIEEFIRKKSTLWSMGKLKFLTAKSQDILRRLKDKAKLIIDAYGALFYSVNRVELIELYYNALAKGGRAYIVVGQAFHVDPKPEHGERPFDYVVLKGQTQPIELYQYLIQTYPSIFQMLRPNGIPGHWVLEMRQTDQLQKLNLNLSIDESQVGIVNDWFPANAIYHEK